MTGDPVLWDRPSSFVACPPAPLSRRFCRLSPLLHNSLHHRILEIPIQLSIRIVRLDHHDTHDLLLRIHPEVSPISAVPPEAPVRHPLTRRNRFPMPMLMDATQSATLIKDQLARDVPRIAFPWPMYWGARLAGALPTWVQQRATGRWPGKE